MIGSFRLPVSAAASSSSWAPPADWIDISSVNNNEINLLVTQAVATSFSVTTSSGTYAIDWGDGIVETGRVSGTTYQHSHSTAGTSCSLGYSTWKIRIYGASGTITGFFIKRHTLSSSPQIIPILWAVFGTSGLTSLNQSFYSSSGNGASCALLCSVTIPSLANVTSMYDCFHNCKALIDFVFPASGIGAVTDMVNAFCGCSSLLKIRFPESFGNVNNIMYCFADCSSLVYVYLPSSWGIITNTYAMFQSCWSLYKVILPSSWGLIQQTNSMFYACFTLTGVEMPINMGTAMTSCNEMFAQCYSLTGVSNWDKIGSSTTQVNFSLFVTEIDAYSQPITIASRISRIAINGTSGRVLKVTSIRLTGAGSTYGGASPQVDVSYTSLAVAALNTLFADLPTVTGKTINITGCPGAATCTRTIATGKGWTVTG